LPHTLALEFAEEPELLLHQRVEPVLEVVHVSPDGETELGVELARLDGYAVKGQELKVGQVSSGDESLPMINSPQWALNQTVTWRIRVAEAGQYQIAMRTRIGQKTVGSRLAVHVAGQSVSAPTEASTDGLKTTVLGTVKLPAGEHEVVLQAEELYHGHSLGGALRSVLLLPR
jgi:hypothetical protein